MRHLHLLTCTPALIASLCALSACGQDGQVLGDESATNSDSESGEPTMETEGGDGEDSSGDGDGDGDDGPKLDTSPPDMPGVDSCKVADDEMDAIPMCKETAPPDIFDPEIQWEWWGDEQSGENQVVVTPLVANLTDDDQNGEIDLCDDPDIVILASEKITEMPSHLYVFDGDTGDLHYRIDDVELETNVNPALGDIDGDGIVEILAVRASDKRIIAFEHDGTEKWLSDEPFGGNLGSLSLADLDQDGSPEIIGYEAVFDSDGKRLFVSEDWSWSPTAADLDGEPGLEVLWGGGAYHADGTPYFTGKSSPGFTAVANIDDDPEPEIINTSFNGISVLDHEGTFMFGGKPVNVGDVDAYLRPHTIHDFDGDGDAEMAMSTQDVYSVIDFTSDGFELVWSQPVLDASGSAGGTAFDFNRDGQAEAMYADEEWLRIWDGEDPSEPLLEWPRLSRTLFEYPVVADVDNDGAAEIVVVSNECIQEPCNAEPSPAVVVIRDKTDRWMQPRRIWNQHAYHVTNVREDGTIPTTEANSWEQLNTFRTNAQLEDGGVCIPPPQG